MTTAGHRRRRARYSLIGHGEEMGAAVLMRDGRVLALGANGATDLYRTWDGAWNAGPWMPDGARADDAPAAVLPNGRVLLAGDLGDFASPTEMLEFDPTTDSLLRAPTPAGAQISEPAFVERFLVAPSGEVLYASGGAVFAYACGDGPADAWRPTIAGIAANGDGTAHVTGAQLNGLTGGAYYGDDAQMASNFPVARLTDGAGTVRYARTSGFSTMGVATGSATVSCEVSFAGIPDGSYALAIVADGIASGAVPVDVRGGAFGSGGGDVIGDGAGLLGEYWSAHDRSFDGAPTASRTDATVDFDWGPGSPDASVSSDHFTARWTGQVLAPRDGAYTVTVVGDDGVRLWIDGQLVIDAWYDEAPTAHSGGVTLARGTRHDVRLEYYEDGGGAVARLLWTLPGDGQAATVPSTQLYPATSGSGGGSGLTGEYWSNQLATFDGSPTVTRVDADVDFDWGSGSPDPSVTSDHFTARWTGQVLAPSDGTYTFTVVGDDGVRLWIDGQPVIDAWYDEAPTAHDGSVTLAAGTRHDVRLDYYEDGGGAVARLLWTTPGASGSAVVPTSALFPASPTGTGLTAQYWSDQLATFDGAPTLTRVDPTVDFDWGSGSPDGSISSDDFSARWTGQVLAPATDDYTFAVTGDDGVRLWVGGELVIDAWYDQPPTRYTATVRLTGGQRSDVRLDFYEHAGGATARLHWSSSAIADQAIPTVDLFPAAPAAAWEPAPPTAAQ